MCNKIFSFLRIAVSLYLGCFSVLCFPCTCTGLVLTELCCSVKIISIFIENVWFIKEVVVEEQETLCAQASMCVLCVLCVRRSYARTHVFADEWWQHPRHDYRWSPIHPEPEPKVVSGHRRFIAFCLCYFTLSSHSIPCPHFLTCHPVSLFHSMLLSLFILSINSSVFPTLPPPQAKPCPPLTQHLFYQLIHSSCSSSAGLV